MRKPGVHDLDCLRDRCRDLPLSYAEVGCTGAAATPGYNTDSYRVQLGNGAEVFARATQAVHEWRMLQLGWVEPCWPDAPIEPGTLVGTQARLFGLWAVNLCRIIQVIDATGPVSRFGLAYGTLRGHAESGEERFLIEWQHADDSVWYDIRAVSKPGGWLTWLGYPMTRRLQRRFGRDSMRVMTEAIQKG